MTEEPKPTTPAPGTRSSEQTFLVGEQVYIRTFEPGDEKNATSWRNSVFPASPERIEKWIKEVLPKEGKNKRGHLAIVRKADDVLVGSISSYVGGFNIGMSAHVDPLYGDEGEHWLAEGVDLVSKWQAEENSFPGINLWIRTNHADAIDELLKRGFVETSRHRETLQLNGQRYDTVCLSYFSTGWREKLGDPMQVEMPRSGKGEVQPIKPSVKPEGDPPKNAVIIGERVYLRPQDKKDAKREVELARMEDETFYDIGRHLHSEAGWAHFISSGHGEDHPGMLWFSVCLRDNDEVIGAVGLLDIDWVNRTAETGSAFYSSENRGKGYGSEAKQLLLEYTFDVLGMHMVTSFVYFPNTRSAAALRKQGYHEAGRVCWLYTYEGGFGNMATFDLLAREWRALPRV